MTVWGIIRAVLTRKRQPVALCLHFSVFFLLNWGQFVVELVLPVYFLCILLVTMCLVASTCAGKGSSPNDLSSVWQNVKLYSLNKSLLLFVSFV